MKWQFFLGICFFSKVCGQLNGFKSLEVTSSGDVKSCLFISEDTIWPHPGDSPLEKSLPQLVCESLGLEVAELSTPEEVLALQEAASIKKRAGRKFPTLGKENFLSQGRNFSSALIMTQPVQKLPSLKSLKILKLTQKWSKIGSKFVQNQFKTWS